MSSQAVKKFIHKLYNEQPHVSLGLAWHRSPDMYWFRWCEVYRGHRGHTQQSVTECIAAGVESADMRFGVMTDTIDQQGLEIKQIEKM